MVVYCDFHGHSRKQNVFIYGCDTMADPATRLQARVFPRMLSKNAPTKFSYKGSKFNVHKSKVMHTAAASLTILHGGRRVTWGSLVPTQPLELLVNRMRKGTYIRAYSCSHSLPSGGYREGGDVEGDGGTQQLHNGGHVLWLSAGRREGTAVLHT